MSEVRIVVGDALTRLKDVPDGSVQCVVTSPPYWGLRNYGMDGQIGLETTPESYVQNLVAVFREVRRVLRDDGVIFLNLGDSFYGSGKGLYGDGRSHGTDGIKQKTNVGSVGVQRAVENGNGDRVPQGYPSRDLTSENLCGGCEVVLRFRNLDSVDDRVPARGVSISSSSPEHRESPPVRQDNSDSLSQADRIATARPDQTLTADPALEPPSAWPVSTPLQSSRLRQGDCRHCANCDACLNVLASLSRESRACVRRMSNPSASRSLAFVAREIVGEQQNTGDIAGTADASVRHISDTGSPYPHSTIQCRLKPKDLVGIPWRVAFALQADGWVLRQDVIWNKPNAMPESVRDRCTRSHEYIFMFSKAKWIGAPRRSLADISDDDARWLALFVDTEGNITVKRSTQASGKTTYGIQVSFANTHRGLLDRARTIIGRGTILERPGKNAPMFYLQISNIQAADLLARLYPHLIVKQRQARLGMFLQTILADSEEERHTKMGQRRGRGRSDAYTAKLELLWAANKALNHFGNPDISWIPAPSFGRWDSQPYYYDADAIKEPLAESTLNDPRNETGRHTSQGKWNELNLEAKPSWYQRKVFVNMPDSQRKPPNTDRHDGGLPNLGAASVSRVKTAETPHLGGRRQCPEPGEPHAFGEGGRNKRDVWTVTTSGYPDAHFATFPPALIEPCIKAGTSEAGACEICGEPLTRVTQRIGGPQGDHTKKYGKDAYTEAAQETGHSRRAASTTISKAYRDAGYPEYRTAGWRRTCGHTDVATRPCVVLDPFGGAGTTGLVAALNGRDALLVELNPEYVTLARNRIGSELGLLAQVEVVPESGRIR